jgi:Na+(H+)/acetate symporter ActP
MDTGTLTLGASLLLAVLGAVFGGLALTIFWALEQSEDVAMSRFYLQDEASADEFDHLFYGNIAVTVSLVTFTMGVLFQRQTLQSVGLAWSAISAILPVYVFYRWARRLQ